MVGTIVDCESRRFWFDGQTRQCWTCVPPPFASVIQVGLNKTIN